MNIKTAARDLIMLGVSVLLGIVGLIVYELTPLVMLPFVFGDHACLMAFVNMLGFIPFGMIFMGKLESRKDSLTAFCIIGIAYIYMGELELLVLSLLVLFISGFLRLKKDKKIGMEALITALVITIPTIILYVATGKMIHATLDVVLTVFWGFLLSFLMCLFCDAATRMGWIEEEKFDDEIKIKRNYRKHSVNLRFMVMINLACAILIAVSFIFSYRLLTSQVKYSSTEKDFLLQTMVANELADYEQEIRSGTEADMELVGQSIESRLTDVPISLPANLVVAVRQGEGYDYVKKGYYLVEMDEAEFRTYHLEWVPDEQEISSMFLYEIVPEVNDIAIEFLTTPELTGDYTKLFRQIIGALIVLIIAINLIAQSMVYKNLVKPINRLTSVAVDFAYDSHSNIEKSKTTLEKLDIQSGDEVESLYTSLSRTMSSMTDYIDEVKETSQKIADMQHNVIVTMADIIESRDENTGGHIKRTAVYVELIANKLREQGLFEDILTDEYVKNMVVAAPLHDMGKIHVPDAILNKNGRLDDDEFAVMKSHASAGKELLKQASVQIGTFEYLDIALKMAGSHHEWWNGNGYPEKIAGDRIPLCARIMAVADVFDALVSKRCYKDGMPLEKAVSIIREETGTHFDPVVAGAFMECLDDVERVLNEM